jgi:metal transporter CNNM
VNPVISALLVILLVASSAVCSGLNVAFMSLDVADLKRKVALNNRHAQKVIGLRMKSHLSLASILLTNVAVISATSLVLGEHLDGLLAGLISTLLIVIFGEVVPQALFAQHALAFCAFFSPLLKLMVIVTYPVSKPLQLLLDKLLGSSESQLHSRAELGIILSEHLRANSSELDEDEVEIMKGALLLSEKKVRDIMTPIKQVYWLTPETIIDADRIDEIKFKGWSRIPILNTSKTACYGILLLKDLVDIDFDNNPCAVDTLPLHATISVGSRTALDTMFRKFISIRSHLVTVERDGVIVGVVTIEDLLEEILGHEIRDEKDT